MPERLEAQYIAEDGAKKTPVMIHRAILGTFERFIGILIEHYAGKLPLWLASTQVVLMSISEKQYEYGKKMHEILKKNHIRAHFDLRNEKIGFKIREHTLQKVPYLLIVGDEEVFQNLVSVRACDGTDLGQMSIDALCTKLLDEINTKARVEPIGGINH